MLCFIPLGAAAMQDFAPEGFGFEASGLLRCRAGRFTMAGVRARCGQHCPHALQAQHWKYLATGWSTLACAQNSIPLPSTSHLRATTLALRTRTRSGPRSCDPPLAPARPEQVRDIAEQRERQLRIQELQRLARACDVPSSHVQSCQARLHTYRER